MNIFDENGVKIQTNTIAHENLQRDYPASPVESRVVKSESQF